VAAAAAQALVAALACGFCIELILFSEVNQNKGFVI
jgi:hypothetical protein